MGVMTAAAADLAVGQPVVGANKCWVGGTPCPCAGLLHLTHLPIYARTFRQVVIIDERSGCGRGLH